ncbi:MAG: sigma 54-interacting transcriptional regulator [Deltaproteobacteria bacterium]|nr:sigma 54-interacting transcriptional regulator [Deltaproteobacteria bacterium]
MAASTSTDLQRLKAQLEQTAEPEARAALGVQIGSLAARVGDHELALLHLTAARRFYQVSEHAAQMATVDGLLGVSCAAKGEAERAVTYLERGLVLARPLDAAIEARLSCELGLVRLALGQPDLARACLTSARTFLEARAASAELTRVMRGLAVLAKLSNDLPQAGALVDRSLELAEQCGDALELGRSLLERAHVHQRTGDVRAARRYFRRAIACFADHELTRDLGEAYYAYGVFVGESQGQLSEGFGDPPAFWLAKAQELFREHGSLADIERVRDGFRRFGRRGTDRVADVQVQSLIQDLKQGRLELRREVSRLVDLAVEGLARLGGTAPAALQQELEAAAQQLTEQDRLLGTRMDAMAAAEERFLGALNTVVLERENIRTLLDLSRALNRLGAPGAVAHEAVQMAAQLTGADRALLVLRDDAGALRVRGSLRLGEPDAHEWRGIVERVVQAGPLLLERDSGRGGRAEAPESGTAPRVRLGYAIATPLRLADKVFGAVYADKELCGGVFTEHDLDLLVIFCSQVATILENVRIAEEMRAQARTKAVTLEAISDGVISLDPPGRVTSLNSVAARYLGVDPHQADRLSITQFPDLAFLHAALSRGEEIDARVVRVGSGEFLVSAHTVRGDGGVLIGLVATFTEMRRAQSLAQRIVGSTARFSFGDIIGNAGSMRRQIHLAEAAARSDSSILITGGSGTGKELFAQAIHNAGTRSAGPFVGINCAAIPRELLESELFGYEAGAFTGAKRGGHPGKFELAEGGTILLDEIGDMPLEMQAKLLRVLQERRVQRIGGTRDIRLDARVIATTNRDLSEDVERGRFRQDLLFRLKVIHIPLPSLHERAEDIPLLASHFLELFATRLGKKLHALGPEVMRALMEYPWPGNVRELENVLESEVNLASDESTTLDQVPEALRHRVRGRAGSRPERTSLGVTSIEDAERELLRAALVQHHGRIPEVAHALGVSRGTVYNKMRKFNFDPLQFRREGSSS